MENLQGKRIGAVVFNRNGGSYTERAWREGDALEDVVAEANVDISMKVTLEQGKAEEEYADMILDFLEDLYLSGRLSSNRLNRHFRKALYMKTGVC